MKAAGKQRQLALTDAQRALQRGDWRCAARELEQAAEMARIEGDATRAAQCRQMAAALRCAFPRTNSSSGSLERHRACDTQSVVVSAAARVRT